MYRNMYKFIWSYSFYICNILSNPWRGDGPWMKRSVENFRFLGKNADIWQQLFYHSISITNAITKTAKDLLNAQSTKMTKCTPFVISFHRVWHWWVANLLHEQGNFFGCIIWTETNMLHVLGQEDTLSRSNGKKLFCGHCLLLKCIVFTDIKKATEIYW